MEAITSGTRGKENDHITYVRNLKVMLQLAV